MYIPWISVNGVCFLLFLALRLATLDMMTATKRLDTSRLLLPSRLEMDGLYPVINRRSVVFHSYWLVLGRRSEGWSSVSNSRWTGGNFRR